MNRSLYLELPYDGEWNVLWGGDTKDMNAHHDNTAQRHAFDFIVKDSQNSSHKGEGKNNEDYYAFGRDVLVPGPGVVIEASDGVHDNTPMDTNPLSPAGNHVIIKHSDREYSLLAHLLCGSLTVEAGAQVETGQKIGECGNSGNSSEPHIHYHLQSSDIIARFNPDGSTIDIAIGVKALFKNIQVRRDGGKETMNHYSPVKGDYISKLK